MKVKLGISACLLGEKVRYNGGHTLDRFLRDQLGQYVDYFPVCPEVEIGLGTPRETLRLVGDPDAPRLLTAKTGIDHTDKMVTWAQGTLDRLAEAGICGYVFKSKSPSSGMARIKIYDGNGGVRRGGVGIFARAFMERFPQLPVEDEGRLQDVGLRENFIVRVFTYQRWQESVKGEPSPGALVNFHTRNKYLFMAHHAGLMRQMGKLTAQARSIPTEQLISGYEAMMTDCLKHRATAKKNADVLYHMMGYFKKSLEAWEKQELTETIENYRKEFVPLMVPMTLINHYVRKYDAVYLKDQYYLAPHPIELKLRNHA